MNDDEKSQLTREAMKKCRKAAGEKREVVGTIVCPACGGKLAYSIAASNGHLWGRCETPNCLRWMQ